MNAGVFVLMFFNQEIGELLVVTTLYVLVTGITEVLIYVRESQYSWAQSCQKLEKCLEGPLRMEYANAERALLASPPLSGSRCSLWLF